MVFSLFFGFIGKVSLQICTDLGRYILFIVQICTTLWRTPLKVDKVLAQMEKIGIQSLPISMMTGAFAGGIIALQTYASFRQFGSEHMIGPVVALTMARELGPVLTGLMVAGRCSSGIAAELGTMRITEQIDALETLCIDNFQYLVVPRVLASTFILPLVTVFSVACGIFGGFIVCAYVYGLNPIDFIDGIKELMHSADILNGLIKASFFGFVLSSIGAFQGFYTWGGAKGVGIATTQSVVYASITIFASNYFLSTLLFGGV
ncbi:MAG: MlaE family ABC transporter permease [Candidatus Chromulinivorax sp.]